MVVVAPAAATYRTSKSANVIDYFIVTKCLTEQVASCTTLRDFPLRPHSPVKLVQNVFAMDKVPVLETPTKLPLQRPFGPAPEAKRWERLDALIEEAHVYINTRPTSQPERVQLLDHVYRRLVKYLERHICSVTDTPLRRSSCRGKAPRIRWVDPTTRARSSRDGTP